MNNTRYFKMEKSDIGKYIVRKFQTHTCYDGEFLCGTSLVDSNKKRVDIIFCPCKIELYHGDFNYKVVLRPVGLYGKFVGTRPWYTCDVEHSLTNQEETGADIFNTEEEAFAYAQKQNNILYPPKKKRWYHNIIEFFKNIDSYNIAKYLGL